MKPEHPSASQPPVHHQFEHEVPTVIHNPEEDMTALGRWFHHAYQNPARFWGLAGTVVFGVLAAVILSNYFSSARSSSSDVWVRLEEAKKAGEKVEVAKEYPSSPAATWALLQAANEYYQDGFGDLPNNRDAALPALKKALDLFDQVSKEAPKDSPVARHALLGRARTLEARNELPKAIEQYKAVAKTWPESPEGKMADSLAKSLETPGAAAFYKDLYAYQPPKATLPPEGQGSLPSSMSLPGLDLSPGLGGLGGAGTSAGGSSPFPFLPAPPASTTKPADSLPPLTNPETKPAEPSTPKAATPDAPKEKAPAQPTPAKPEAKPAAPAEPAKGAAPAKP